MRFQLDAETARWFQHGLMRPVVVAAGLDSDHADKLAQLWDSGEGVLDLSKVLDDHEFLVWLVSALVGLVCTGEEVYAPLADLAERVAHGAGTSIVDRLAALYDKPPPVAINSNAVQARDRAAQKIKKRFGL